MKGFSLSFLKKNPGIWGVGLLLFLSIGPLSAQEGYNLKVLWERTKSPDSSFSDSTTAFGGLFTAGDLNGDGYEELIIVGDSVRWDSTDQVLHPFIFKAYIFLGGPSIDTVPFQVLEYPTAIFSLRCIEDIDSDGYEDLAIGSFIDWSVPCYMVYIYFGGPTIPTEPGMIIRSPTEWDFFFGCTQGSIAPIGDVNGDGYGDLAIGAYGSAVPWPGELAGRVFIYHGGPEFDEIPDLILEGGHEWWPEGFGGTVGGGGDVNGDGFDDLIVGAPNFGPGLTPPGRVYIYFGGDPMDTIYDVAMKGEPPYVFLGCANVDILRNEPGYDYAVFGNPSYGVTLGPGRIYILFGGSPMDSVPDVVITGRPFPLASHLGMWTEAVGDLNQDGCDEIISGAPGELGGRGAGYLYLGGPELDTIPDAWLRGGWEQERYRGLGWNVSSGDPNGDGIPDLLISNYAAIFNQTVWVCKYIKTDTADTAKPDTLKPDTLPEKTALFQNSPNPMRGTTEIGFQLARPSLVSLKIYDVSGRLVRRLIPEGSNLGPGVYSRPWDGRDSDGREVPAGVYFYTLEVKSWWQGGRFTKKLIVAR